MKAIVMDKGSSGLDNKLGNVHSLAIWFPHDVHIGLSTTLVFIYPNNSLQRPCCELSIVVWSNPTSNYSTYIDYL